MKTHSHILVARLFLMGASSRTFADISPAALPILRILTDTSARKLDVSILEKSDITVKVRRSSDDKMFSLDLDKLSAEDREFVKRIQPALPAAGRKRSTKP